MIAILTQEDMISWKKLTTTTIDINNFMSLALTKAIQASEVVLFYDKENGQFRVLKNRNGMINEKIKSELLANFIEELQ